MVWKLKNYNLKNYYKTLTLNLNLFIGFENFSGFLNYEKKSDFSLACKRDQLIILNAKITLIF